MAYWLGICLLSLSAGVVSGLNRPDADFDTRVRMNFLSAAHNKLNEQLERVTEAAYLLDAYHDYYNEADISRPCFANFFKKLSNVMKNEAHIIKQEIVLRGGVAVQPSKNLADICKDVASSDAAEVLDSTDADRFCICTKIQPENLLTNAAFTGRCAKPMAEWKNGLWGLTDASRIFRWIQKYNTELDKQAITTKDVQLSQWTRQTLKTRFSMLVSHTYNVATKLRVLKDLPTYYLGEEVIDLRVMCKADPIANIIAV